jgi:hypothetical protein
LPTTNHHKIKQRQNSKILIAWWWVRLKGVSSRAAVGHDVFNFKAASEPHVSSDQVSNQVEAYRTKRSCSSSHRTTFFVVGIVHSAKSKITSAPRLGVATVAVGAAGGTDSAVAVAVTKVDSDQKSGDGKMEERGFSVFDSAVVNVAAASVAAAFGLSER